ncbi:MAG: response regulator, partial [Ktedonobacterales bacterium]
SYPAPAVTQLPTSPMPAATPAPSFPSVTQGPAAARRDFVVAQRPGTGTLPTHTIVPAAGQNTYVLVVDDSPSVRRVVSNMLKANGWDVQTARDGVEALEVIARKMPAAVLLDIEMPRMDGYELMATVRSQDQYRFLPLIVLTSRAATKHQQRALQLGADAYVVKPYQDEELLSTLATLVQARR